MKIRLHGIEESKTNIQLMAPVAKIKDIASVFFGDVCLRGTLTKYRNRFVFLGQVTCNANLICDFCLDEFKEQISAKIEVNLVSDADMFFMQNDNKICDKDEIAVHPDDVYYDITPDICDYLLLNIPARRRCINCKGKKFSDIMPQFSSKK